MHTFPANPNDQDVFEIRPGLFFKFENSTNSWNRITGNEFFPLASPVNDGLMSAQDLKKINRLVIPMPRSTITSEDCQTKFVGGHIDMYGNDEFVQITGKPLLRNNGIKFEQRFRISLHTAAFNFTLDKDAVLAELIRRGQLNLFGKRGPKGLKGPKGDPGKVLPTGPKGPKGDAGVGPTCSTTITQETLKSETKPGNNKAIVDVEVRDVSSTERELVAKRGIIGNPDAAPNRVNARCSENSNWVLAVQRPTGEPQQLLYVDVSGMLTTIFDKFKSEAERIKKKYEDDVAHWLDTMSMLFHQQKELLCCSQTICEKQLAAEQREPQQITIPDTINVSIPDPVTVQGAITFLDPPSILPSTNKRPRRNYADNSNVEVSYCQMPTSRLSWYERSWLSHQCCGLITRIAGQDYIIVKCSLGNDLSWGGGESEDAPCIREFINTVGHPAFAWPTIDGQNFLTLPPFSHITFRYDNNLTDLVIDNIDNGDYRELRGGAEPADIVSVVLFPSIT